jgi:hypothetical protein
VLDLRLAWAGGEHARVVDSVVDYPLEIMIRNLTPTLIAVTNGTRKGERNLDCIVCRIDDRAQAIITLLTLGPNKILFFRIDMLIFFFSFFVAECKKDITSTKENYRLLPPL